MTSSVKVGRIHVCLETLAGACLYPDQNTHLSQPHTANNDPTIKTNILRVEIFEKNKMKGYDLISLFGYIHGVLFYTKIKQGDLIQNERETDEYADPICCY